LKITPPAATRRRFFRALELATWQVIDVRPPLYALDRRFLQPAKIMPENDFPEIAPRCCIFKRGRFAC
jgi:hypothetical protein